LYGTDSRFHPGLITSWNDTGPGRVVVVVVAGSVVVVVEVVVVGNVVVVVVVVVEVEVVVVTPLQPVDEHLPAQLGVHAADR
jgi:hypothetical protein